MENRFIKGLKEIWNEELDLTHKFAFVFLSFFMIPYGYFQCKKQMSRSGE